MALSASQALSTAKHIDSGDTIPVMLNGSLPLLLGDTALLNQSIPLYYLFIVILGAAIFFIYREQKIRKSRRKLNHMIQARSRELEFQQEELRTQIEFTTIQNHKIDKQNKELEKHHQHLEHLVKKRTRDLEAAKKRAEESDRLKSAFLANMSHEIRTPMNAIVGFTNIMIEEQLSEGEQKELLQHIHDSSNHLLKLIENIIDISKIEAGELKFKFNPLDINDLVDEVQQDYASNQEVIRKGLYLKIEKESPYQDVSVNSDHYRVKQILTNMMDNAIKFTYKGEIVLGYHLTTLENERAVEFYVSDTGIGMSPHQQEHIFDLFRKNTNSQTTLYGGTGIGLSICRKLARLLSGKIDVSSKTGEGSRFSVIIPHKAPTPQEEQVANGREPDGFRGRKKSVLLLGQKNDFHSFMKQKLSADNIQFHSIREGQEAIRVFKHQHQDIDLVIVDTYQQWSENLETVHTFRKLNQSVPIVGLTREFSREHNQQLASNSFDEFFRYDVDPDKLMGFICDTIQ